jgi:hypothetical protein
MGVMMSKPQKVESLLDSVDPEKRQFIGKLIGTGAFVAPLVASFSMANIVNAEAAPLNGSLK